MGPASVFQVTLVLPYREVDNLVEAITKRYKEKEENREHGRKKTGAIKNSNS